MGSFGLRTNVGWRGNKTTARRGAAPADRNFFLANRIFQFVYEIGILRCSASFQSSRLPPRAWPSDNVAPTEHPPLSRLSDNERDCKTPRAHIGLSHDEVVGASRENRTML
jgi:hypothetical protein